VTHIATTPGSVGVLLLYVAAFIALLAPGYALAQVLVGRFNLERAATLPIAYVVGSLAGYAAFWCYLFSPGLGRVVSIAWAVAALLAIRRVWRTGLPHEEAVPLALTFAAGLFYLAVLYIPTTAIGAGQRFFVLRPPDNVLPQMFAEKLYHGEDARHLVGDWLSSDRPPLQTGIQLLVRPFFPFGAHAVDLAYEVAGVVAQLAWLPAAWLLCTRLGFSARQRAFALAFAIGSGFCLYNTVYTWPKLLAAGLGVAALVFALPRPRENRDASLILAGVCAALALLAHGSAVFFIVPAVVLIAAARRLPLRRGLAFGALAGAMLLLPWSAYQRFYDPPGDRLLKMHLAGINDVDPRPAGAAIAQAYARTPFDSIVRNKIGNVETAAGAAPLMGAAIADEPLTTIGVWRLREREHVTAALGVANLGWLALAWWWLRPARRDARGGVTALVGIALAATAFWCVALWGPGATVTTHSAYAIDLVLLVALGAALAELPPWLTLVVLGLECCDLAVTWIAGSLPDAWRVAPLVDPLMALVAPAAAAAAGIVLAGEIRQPGAAAGDAVSARRP
jgi:hypothetical protein